MMVSGDDVPALRPGHPGHRRRAAPGRRPGCSASGRRSAPSGRRFASVMTPPIGAGTRPGGAGRPAAQLRSRHGRAEPVLGLRRRGVVAAHDGRRGLSPGRSQALSLLCRSFTDHHRSDLVGSGSRVVRAGADHALPARQHRGESDDPVPGRGSDRRACPRRVATGSRTVRTGDAQPARSGRRRGGGRGGGQSGRRRPVGRHRAGVVVRAGDPRCRPDARSRRRPRAAMA